MTIFAVEYVYDSRSEDLDALRPEHREFLRGLHEDGSLITAGRWADAAAPGALLIVRAEDHDSALALLDPDPFYRAHLVTTRTARAWAPAVGDLA